MPSVALWRWKGPEAAFALGNVEAPRTDAQGCSPDRRRWRPWLEIVSSALLMIKSGLACRGTSRSMPRTLKAPTRSKVPRLTPACDGHRNRTVRCRSCSHDTAACSQACSQAWQSTATAVCKRRPAWQRTSKGHDEPAQQHPRRHRCHGHWVHGRP